MALLLQNKTYLKVYKNGAFEIYKTKASRNRFKKATSPQEVIDKYNEILNSFMNNVSREQAYYDPNAFSDDAIAWQDEAYRYYKNLTNYNTAEEYPLMSQYIQDVKDTIPELVESGEIWVPDTCKNVKDVYEYIKEYEMFGPTTEVKDV